MIGAALKRIVDVGAAAAGLLVAGPGMALIAIAIKLDSPGPIIFAQDRIGRNGRVFKLLKFRTMIDAPIRYNADGSTRIDANDDRVTRVGRYLRGALDELPQLINVVRGDMSLVGPRPEMANQRHMYRPGDERKLELRPGITSLAIVHWRNSIPWAQRIAIDLQYVERWSFSLDARILVQTLLLPLGLRPFRFDDVLDGELLE